MLRNRTTDNDYKIRYYDYVDQEDKIQNEIWLTRNIDKDHYLIIIQYALTDFLNSNEFAVLTIRKIENKYAIFINYKLFYVIYDKNFSYIPGITTHESVTKCLRLFSGLLFAVIPRQASHPVPQPDYFVPILLPLPNQFR